MTLDEIKNAPEKELKEPVRVWPFLVTVGMIAISLVSYVTVENVNRRIATLENRASHYRSENVELTAAIAELRDQAVTNFRAHGDAIALAVQIAEEKRIVAPPALVRDIEATLDRARSR